jgi:Squalene-hopene cyclase N-terminal domain
MTRIPLLCVLAAVAWTAVPARAESPANKLDARQAVERSLPFLEKEGLAWMQNRKCVACHHAAFMLWSHREAQVHGVVVEQAKFDAWREQALTLHLGNQKNFEKNKTGGVETAHLLLGGVLPASEDEKAVATRQTFAALLLNAQREDGHWNYEGQGQKRPANEANETTTLWAALALTALEKTDEAALKGRQQALAWAKKNTTGEGNEAAALRLLIEAKFGDAAKAKELAKALAARQNTDGGWSWSKEFPSDSFATGQSLYALAKAGVPSDDPALQKAVKYLLEAQRPDGSWYAPSKKPEKKDNPIAVYWGTAWATIGLAQTLPPVKTTNASPLAAWRFLLSHKRLKGIR